MNQEAQDFLIISTIIVDIFLFWILFTQSLNLFDSFVAYSAIILHFFLYLFINLKENTDLLHLFFTFYVSIFPFFVTNFYLLLLLLGLVLFMVGGWIFNEKCFWGNFGSYPTVREFSEKIIYFSYFLIIMVICVSLYKLKKQL